MQRESILLLGDDRGTYHRLRSELRSSSYRLLRSRNERVAKWLMERVKIGLVLLADPASENRTKGMESLSRASRAATVETETGLAHRPMLVISRSERADASKWARRLDESEPVSTLRSDQSRRASRTLAAAAGIPTLQILENFGSASQSALPAAINEGAAYILFAPYEQTELIQAIRTAMLNGPVTPDATPAQPCLEIALQDRMCSLHTSREQMGRLFIGAVEQLQHARTKASWCEAENRSLRQALMREQLESPFRTEGLPEAVRGVAHDFSNLLEAAGGAATSVYGQPQSPKMYRAAMDGTMEQARELLECLIDLTRVETQSWRTAPVELDAVVMKALKAALVPLREPQIQVRVRLGGLEPVWAHHALVYRALVNLLWNAVQAMPNGGLLSIIGYVRGDRVVIEVGDTGVGIGAQDRKKVLQEAFSTKDGHYGMGLTLVRDLIEKCGGEITFSSRPRHGSLFSIALRIAKTARAEKVADRESAARFVQPSLWPAPENRSDEFHAREKRVKGNTPKSAQPHVVLQP